MDGHPELVAFSPYPEKDGLHEVNGEMRSGFIPWHMDYRWMMHLAAGVPLGEERVVQRTTILSKGEIGRSLEEGGWKWSDVEAG